MKPLKNDKYDIDEIRQEKEKQIIRAILGWQPSKIHSTSPLIQKDYYIKLPKTKKLSICSKEESQKQMLENLSDMESLIENSQNMVLGRVIDMDSLQN
ncbi:unnamed protein product [Paramecium sonneborni]|uniref:Uncharacterized protein n=1 Tax=Paramecium sonneborni TaxID=65129 RepID=A0A8S1QTP0_9CILI|nr:unnamed protein product [Paramecium sonneborni]